MNIGYKFYKEYFNDIKIDINHDGEPTLDGASTYQKLSEYCLANYKEYLIYFNNDYINKDNELKLTTTYPGLLIGSGYAHGIGSNKKDGRGDYLVKNELKLGFFFDHTTGLPVISGSSVKGVLKSAFEKANGEYIRELLLDLKVENAGNLDIKGLEKNIFEGDENTSIYKRDVFFDAFPVKSGNNKNGNNVFLANDYITHHENPLKNPNPVQFLKILPQVTFQFNFKLTNNGLNADFKKELFKQILLDLGIGAKTNVGYGQFTEPEELRRLEEIKVGDIIECIVNEKIRHQGGNEYQIYLRPKINDYENYLSALNKPLPSIKIGIYDEAAQVNKGMIVKCIVKRFLSEGRVGFENRIEIA